MSITILLFIYEVLFGLALLLYIPKYIWQGKFSPKAFIRRFSFFSFESEDKESIWIQAVSVGEVLAVKKLVNQLRQRSSLRLVLSSTTLSGYKVAVKHFAPDVFVFFFPFDFTFVLKRVIKKVKPKVFVSIETEIWPNLYYQLKQKAVPTIILNGRVSDEAYRRYRAVKFIVKKILSLCSYIGVQNEDYRQKFISLGAPPQIVCITGNIKFDSLESSKESEDKFNAKYAALLKKDSDLLLIAASTHRPEEKIILDI
ncbi:MAG: glycosyltransferase N-terminal domain-containing protein, partial [Candidatus Omnitrophota bacterium]